MYRYNGKELDEATRLYDYGARYYDPAIARWGQVDNLAEKYVSYSPYHYAGNNPVLNLDIDGNQFTSSAQQYVNKLLNNLQSREERNNSRIEGWATELEAGGLSTRKANRIQQRIDGANADNDAISGIRGEINVLDESSQVYNVVSSSALNECGSMPGTGTKVAGTSFNTSTGAVDITISGYDTGLFAHELLHAYQFETGQISLGETGSKAQPFLLDKTDEVAGYLRQGMFGSSEGVSSPETLPARYSNLPSGPVSVHNFSTALSAAINFSNTAGLQRTANYYKQAFRVNGTTTYSPK